LDEDHRTVQRAERELKDEQRRADQRKVDMQRRQKQMMVESKAMKADEGEVRKARLEEERAKVEEYKNMLDEQQMRNRQPLAPIRGADAVIAGPPGGRRGQDFYREDNLMKQLHDATREAERRDAEKHSRVKEMKQRTQDYLFHQIAERNRNREKALEQKRNLKIQAQAAAAEHLETEQRRMDEARRRNFQYRAELEEQMAAKRAAQRAKQAEDQMSPAERAINQRLIREAQGVMACGGRPEAMRTEDL